MSKLSFLKAGNEHGDEKPILCIYGPPDAGKTSLAAEFPGCVFIRVGDVGVVELQRNGQVPDSIASTDLIDSYTKLNEVLDSIVQASDADRPKSICVDGLGGVQELIFRHVCDTDFKGNRIAFGSYNKGPERAVVEFQGFLEKCFAIRRKGSTVILVAHSHTVEDTNPLGESFLKICPRLHKLLLAVAEQEIPNIGYITPVIATTEDGLRTKAVTGAGRPQRMLHFVGVPAMVAKTKMGISRPVSMGNTPKEAFNNLVAAIAEAKTANQSKAKESK